jgi:hypothetical protein
MTQILALGLRKIRQPKVIAEGAHHIDNPQNNRVLM